MKNKNMRFKVPQDIIYFGLIPLVSENNAKENKYIGSIAGGEQGYV